MMRRRIVLLGAALIVVGSLAGCDSFGHGPGALTVGDEGLMLAVCESTPVGHASLEFREPLTKGEDLDATLDVPLYLEAEDEIPLRELFPELDGMQFRAGTEIGIILDPPRSDSSSGSDYLSVVFTVPADGMVEGRWLHPDGPLTELACDSSQ